MKGQVPSIRTHGWLGSPPKTDEEAVARILQAADRRIKRAGARTSIADVAQELGVSRATVYRYFDSTTDLLAAAAALGTQEFMRRVGKRLSGLTDPAEIIIEGIVETITQAPGEPYLRLLLEEPTHALLRSVTSESAREFGRAVLSESTSPDWGSSGDHDLDGLLEWALRAVQSFLSAPGDPPRSPEELREYLWQWMGPSIRAWATDARAPEPGP